jgi:pimeloyl-ACP methyl ester carboxylesterase
LVERLLDPSTPAGRRRFVRFLVHFGQDPAVAEPTPGVERSRRHATGPCRFEVLPGASHWAPNEVPDRLVALIDDHLATAGTAR